MTFTEGGANVDIGKKKTIESKNILVKNKENFVGIKKPLAKPESLKTKVDTPTMKEIQKTFPRLSKAWIEKVALSYKQFDSKAVADFFAAIKKYDSKNYPQSLIATSLIQYGKNVNGGVLSVANYETYLQSLVAENDRLKNLYNTFSTKNDPAFADFKRFKEKYKGAPQTIDQISQGKGFTNETYVFFQYLSSSSFKANKSNIIGSLSLDDRKQFSQYLKSDARIAQIVGVAPADVVKNTELGLEEQSQEKPKEGSFADAKNTFMSDATKENGPKQIVENVDQTVFGTEWLAGEDLQDVFLRFQKTFSKAQRESLLARYPQLIPAKMNKQKFVDYCMGVKIDKRFDPKRGAVYKAVFETIVKKGLQPQTKEDIQEHVMDVYFEQVAGILKAGGEIVKTESIVYNKDGTIDMKYSTPRGIQGTIHISPTGEVTILDMFAYRSENEKGDNQNIIEKIQSKLMDGRLPSMKEMMSRCSKDKGVIFDTWESKIVGGNTDNQLIEKEKLVPQMVTSEEEHSRKILDISMNKMLSMTQTADKLGEVVDHTYKVLGTPQNDIYTKYLRGEVGFIDSKANPQIEGLFALRTDLLNTPEHIERFNNAVSLLFQTYNSSSISKENYPFGVLDESGKETLFQFISRFCTSEKEFDIVKFETCIQNINAKKPSVPASFGDFYQDNVILFPSKSLYLNRYPQENIQVQKDKETTEIIGSTKKELSDLKSEIQLGIDLDKAKIS